MLAIKTEKFEGPLDLLLQLIEQEQLDITTVSLARITEHYIAQLESLAWTRNPDELADFLVVASKLLLIKSRSLLPHLSMEDEREIEGLKQQLKIYQEFHRAAKMLDALSRARTVLFHRQSLPISEIVSFAPPHRWSTEKLARIFLEVWKRQERPAEVTRITLDPRLSLEQKICEIREMVTKKLVCAFRDVLKTQPSKTEIIVSLLALLELVKQQSALCEQPTLFGEITIRARASVSPKSVSSHSSL